MGKGWKVIEDRFWKQNCLWWWWKTYKSKNKNICRQYECEKKKTPCKCLSIIMLDSVIKANKKYYPQTLLEESKYVQEKIKIENLTDDDLEKSDSNDETESDIDNYEYDE